MGKTNLQLVPNIEWKIAIIMMRHLFECRSELCSRVIDVNPPPYRLWALSHGLEMFALLDRDIVIP
jgi:hypothetical protein